ncbi:hypothetical protein [Aquitalea denitrificans]|uniref:hypothetical protein n=1 Tax=Aquitalea denitrificans TaxID=519081 RepID=UPI0013591FF1|nr:hypothetical protein [Aquitalea denitrificans]
MQAKQNQWPRALTASVLVVALALVIITALPPATLNGWVSLYLVAMVPAQIVITLFWQMARPAFAQGWSRLQLGLGYTLLTVVAGILVANISLMLIEQGLGVPTPFVIMYLIFTVPVTVLLVVVFQGWPVSGLVQNKAGQGVLLWLAAYLLAGVLYYRLFDFSFAAAAPFYRLNVAPQGIFPAWYVLTASLAMLLAVLLLVLFDFWPVQQLASRLGVSSQPWSSLLCLLVVAGMAGVLALAGMMGLHLAILQFMVRVCVSGIFGVFIILVMWKGCPALQLPQPFRGLVLSGMVCVLGVAMHALYLQVASIMPGLASADDLELWIAAGMLSVTFPCMVFFADYFDSWPLPFRRQPDTRNAKVSAQ